MAWLKKKDPPGRRAEYGPKKSVPSFSYHKVRSDQESGLGRNIKKIGVERFKSARKLWLEKFGMIVLAVVVVICLVSILNLSSKSVVILDGNNTSSVYTGNRAAVAATAQKLLSGSVFNSNKVTVDTGSIESKLQADYPMYSNITMSLPLIDQHPIIYLTPAQPAIILNGGSSQYVLNENGQVMLKGTSNLNLPVVNYPNLARVSNNQRILTTSEVQFIQTIVYELSLKGEKVSSIDLPQGTSELDVHLLGLTYLAKFNLQNNDARQQAGSLLATQQYLKTQNVTPGQYIDVRTDGRVYYQ